MFGLSQHRLCCRGAMDGSMIAYSVNGAQKVAVADGFISRAWPVQIRTSRVTSGGVEDASAVQRLHSLEHAVEAALPVYTIVGVLGRGVDK